MKRLALLLTLLLLAITCSDASLLARGRTRTKKSRERVITEAPYVCLDAPTDLPACIFSAETDGETGEKSSRRRRELTDSDVEPDNKRVSPDGDDQAKPQAMIIVYKIEGCIPSRLPFVLPICKQEDSAGRIVQVRRLFPFNVMGSSGYNSDTTLVFPEVDMDQWRRFMNGPWTRPANSGDKADHGDEVNRENVQSEQSSNMAMPKIRKRKKVGLNGIAEKKTTLKKLKKFDQLYGSKEFDENDIFSKLPSVEKFQLGDDRASDTDSYESRSDRSNRIDYAEREDGDINQQVAEKASFAKYTEEFPYAKAIPYDPAKLPAARIDSRFPYTRAVISNTEKLQVPRRLSDLSHARAILYEPRSGLPNGIVDSKERNGDKNGADEFLYAKAMSYDPKKLGVTRVGSEFPYNRAIPYDPVKLQQLRRESEFLYTRPIAHKPISSSFNEIVDEEYNYGFPYAKAIPYDPTKLRVAKYGSEFPYTRAIPYDPVKLRIATRGSEFPYARVIPYDPKELEQRWNGIVDEGSVPFYSRGLKEADEETKSFNSRAVPFDSRMLDAAKEGRIFPYSKAIPDDTSKILEAMELPKSKEPDRIKVPVRHVKTFWDEEVPTYARKIQMDKDERRRDKVLGSREIQKNIINTENEDFLKHHEGSLQTRVTRSAAEASASSDISIANGNLEMPGRWSEFPYSKAIPFDSSKLRRPRSTMEHYLNSPFAIPRDFPYTKAIPYDPSKLTALRRKKSKLHDGSTIF